MVFIMPDYSLPDGVDGVMRHATPTDTARIREATEAVPFTADELRRLADGFVRTSLEDEVIYLKLHVGIRRLAEREAGSA